MNKKIKNKIRISPFIFIFLSFLIVIFIGSFLLWLPISQTENRLSYLDRQNIPNRIDIDLLT